MKKCHLFFKSIYKNFTNVILKIENYKFLQIMIFLKLESLHERLFCLLKKICKKNIAKFFFHVTIFRRWNSFGQGDTIENCRRSRSFIRVWFFGAAIWNFKWPVILWHTVIVVRATQTRHHARHTWMIQRPIYREEAHGVTTMNEKLQAIMARELKWTWDDVVHLKYH